MGIEEQKEEREVLDSIFPDEITDTSDNSYRIAITLDVAAEEDEASDAPPTFYLNVSYPEAYPDVPPNLDLSSPPNAPRQHVYLDISEDKSHLLESLESTIQESLGMAMIFTVVTTLKECAEALIADRQAAAQAVKDVEAQKVEEAENRKFHGTAVTRASFLEWREKFRSEMAAKAQAAREEAEVEDKKKKRSEDKKMTGREMWEKGLVGKGDDEGDVDEDELADGVEKATIEN